MAIQKNNDTVEFAGRGPSQGPTVDLGGQSPFQPLAAGTLLQGRYRIESQLGKGGMGHVYIVRDEHFTGSVGTLPLRSMKEMIPRIDNAQHMINFKREADVLESLRHPNIPRVYDSFEQSKRAYLVLEYVQGQDLEQVLDRTPGLVNPRTVGGWMIQLCKIVQYLHEQRPRPIIFRDLKPSNVILTPDQRIVLIDFGIAKTFEDNEKPHTNVGTQGYAAPEQYRGEAEIRSDVYAMGAMMHHLVTKSDPRFQEPFSFRNRLPRTLNPAVTPELEAVIMKCVEYERDDRYQTVHEMRQALQQALGFADTSQLHAVTRTGLSTTGSWGAGPVAPPVGPRALWTFRTEEEVRSTPTVTNGTLFVGSYDNNLYAVDTASGKLRWKFATEGGICCQPAVYKNAVIFGSEDYYVYALDLMGKESWRFRTHNHVRSSPRVYEDRLYIGSDDHHMSAIDPRSGRALWRYRTYGPVQSSAAYANGLVYFGSLDETFCAVDALTGDRKWSFRANAQMVSSPTVENGVVYFGAMDFAVYALDAKSGWQAWREPTEGFIISSPLIVGDRLYIGSTDKNLYCLDRRTGHPLWKYPAGEQVNSTPAFANGVVYFGCVDGGVYALNAQSGKLLWRFQTQEKVCSSPVVHEGVVYIGSSDGSVYALDANP